MPHQRDGAGDGGKAEYSGHRWEDVCYASTSLQLAESYQEPGVRCKQAKSLDKATGLCDRKEGPAEHTEDEPDHRLPVAGLLGRFGNGRDEGHDGHRGQDTDYDEDGYPDEIPPFGPEQQVGRRDQNARTHDPQHEASEELPDENRNAWNRCSQ